MVRRGLWLLLALAVIGLIAVAAAPDHRPTVRPPAARVVPAVHVLKSLPSACPAGGACAPRVCREFVSAPAVMPWPPARLAPRAYCVRFPNPGGLRVYVRR
jgi:hypothetical protein